MSPKPPPRPAEGESDDLAPPTGSSAPANRRSAAWYLTVSGVLLIAAAVGLAAFAGFAHDSFKVGPARVSASAIPSLDPATTVVVSPFGSIKAATHTLPVSLGISLEELDIPRLERLAMEGLPDGAAVDGLIQDVRDGFTRAIGKGLLAALIAGAFVGWSLRRKWQPVFASAAIAVMAPALLIGATYMTMDLDAFRKPVFRGAISYAPSLIELVQRRAHDIESLRDQVGEMSQDLARYYRSPQSFASGGALNDTYRVLHVTDIHLDPVGLELAEELAKDFRVSLVIDTGDINMYGTSTEASVVTKVIPDKPRRLFIPGNHESKAIVDAMRALPNVTVLEDESVTVDGLRVFGVKDPSSEKLSADVDLRAVERTAERTSTTLKRAVIGPAEATPDIIAMHSNKMVDHFRGQAPLLLAGHTHTPALQQRGSSVYLNSGTTGGIHFTRLRPEPHIPHSASILYYTKETPRRLIAIDQIEVFGLAGQSSLKRTIIEERLLPEVLAKARAEEEAEIKANDVKANEAKAGKAKKKARETRPESKPPEPVS